MYEFKPLKKNETGRQPASVAVTIWDNIDSSNLSLKLPECFEVTRKAILLNHFTNELLQFAELTLRFREVPEVVEKYKELIVLKKEQPFAHTNPDVDFYLSLLGDPEAEVRLMDHAFKLGAAQSLETIDGISNQYTKLALLLIERAKIINELSEFDRQIVSTALGKLFEGGFHNSTSNLRNILTIEHCEAISDVADWASARNLCVLDSALKNEPKDLEYVLGAIDNIQRCKGLVDSDFLDFNMGHLKPVSELPMSSDEKSILDLLVELTAIDLKYHPICQRQAQLIQAIIDYSIMPDKQTFEAVNVLRDHILPKLIAHKFDEYPNYVHSAIYESLLKFENSFNLTATQKMMLAKIIPWVMSSNIDCDKKDVLAALVSQINFEYKSFEPWEDAMLRRLNT